MPKNRVVHVTGNVTKLCTDANLIYALILSNIYTKYGLAATTDTLIKRPALVASADQQQPQRPCNKASGWSGTMIRSVQFCRTRRDIVMKPRTACHRVQMVRLRYYGDHRSDVVDGSRDEVLCFVDNNGIYSREVCEVLAGRRNVSRMIH